jgi:hypothetical protein
MARHPHQEFIRFSQPCRGGCVGGLADPRHPRTTIPRTSTPRCSPGLPAPVLDLPFHAHLLLVGQCLRDLLRRAHPRCLERTVFRSLVDLQAAINGYLASTTANPSRSSRPPIPTASYREAEPRVSSAGITRRSDENVCEGKTS